MAVTSETLQTQDLPHRHGPWPPLCSTQRRNQNSKGSSRALVLWLRQHKERQNHPPVQTPLGLSRVLQLLPHFSPKVSFITHEFPARLHLKFSQFLLEREKKSPMRAYFTRQNQGWISAAHCPRLAGGKG